MDNIASLIEEKSQIRKRLEKLLYGSVEIRVLLISTSV